MPTNLNDPILKVIALASISFCGTMIFFTILLDCNLWFYKATGIWFFLPKDILVQTPFDCVLLRQKIHISLFFGVVGAWNGVLEILKENKNG
jgi:hypothetical protein